MNRYLGAAVLLGALLSSSGCDLALGVTKINDTYSTDANGNIVDVQTWRYSDGVEVTTKRVTDQYGNFVTRGDPDERRVFFDPLHLI